MSDKYTKILLIEDNLSYVRLVQKMLAVSSQVEYQIECADRLSTGLEYLVNGEIDVVLLDLELPDSQGLDTLNKVRAQAPAVPIVVVTGLDDETLAVQAVRQGAQDYLVKGDIDSKTLWCVIRYAVERKQIEEKAAQEAREYAENIAATVREPLIILDADLHVISANRSFYQTFQVAPEKSERQLLYELGNRQWDIPRLRELLEEILPKNTTFDDFEMEHDFPVIGKKSMLLNARRLYREMNKTEMILLAFEDITERKIQAQLVQTEKMIALGTMAAGVAHELLNPMMGMLNFAQYCLKHTAEGDPRYPVLQDIERETRRCADIVGNLTTFSRMGKQGEEGYQEESFTIIIDRVVKLLSYRIEKEHASLTQHVAENTPKIWMEVNSMQQVLLNLISNALDAVKDSKKKEVCIEVHREGAFIQLTVADSGCGLAPENLEKIYDPFFTTKPIGQGTGLGLTTSRSIIDSHGGDITCESILGVGTTFKILLPIKTKGGEK